jgi:hypothetical protein
MMYICCGFRNADDDENVLGDGVVEPAKKALVYHASLRILALCRGWRGRKVGAKPKLPNESVKETTPLGVDGLGNVENDGNA